MPNSRGPKPFVTGKMPKGYFSFTKDKNYVGNKGHTQQKPLTKPSNVKQPTVPAKSNPGNLKSSPKKRKPTFEQARKQAFGIKKPMGGGTKNY